METKTKKTLTFVEEQKKRLEERIQRYMSEKPKEDLTDTNSLSLYTIYKQTQVVPKLRAALERIKNGTYGFCLSCGEPIEKRRLELVPGAEDCMACAKPKK